MITDLQEVAPSSFLLSAPKTEIGATIVSLRGIYSPEK